MLATAVLAQTADAILNVSLTAWVILLLCIGVCTSLEIVNTAIEAVIDLI